MQVVARLKESRDLPWLPIIMQTTEKRPEEMREGIEAGVFYYLTKPVDLELLKSVVAAAVSEAQQHSRLLRELSNQRGNFQLIEMCKFHLSTLEEADMLSGFLANLFPVPEKVVSGLWELLCNAVEHGNLGIGYAEKTGLLNKGTWRDEVIRRAELPENNGKRVEVVFNRTPEGCGVTITDQGAGFPWRNFLHIDPSRSTDNHGRGIAQANLVSFDKLTYNPAGNEVTASVNNRKELEW